MATSYVDLTGDGNNNKAFSFPSYQESDVKVEVANEVKTATTHYNIDSYSTTGGGTVVFTSGNIPTAGQAIRIYRDTDISTNTGEYDPKTTFSAGASVKAGDLNNNQKQALYAIWEEKEQTITSADIKDGAITSAKIEDGTIVNADVNASAAIAGSKLQASSGSNAGSMSSANFTKLAGIEASATADQTDAEIRAAVEAASDSNVFTDADHSKLNAIEASATADQTDAEIRAAVEAATDSNVFTDADHTKLNAIEASATADQTDAEIRAAVEAATDSNVFTDNDHSKLDAIEASADVTDATNVDAAGAVMNSDTSTTAMQFVVDEDDFTSNSDVKVPTQQSTKAYITATSQPKDADLTTLAGMHSDTASILAANTALTSDIGELNMLDGKSIVTTISSPTDVQIPTAQAVDERITTVLSDVGGFVPIANKDSFPETNPDPGDNAGTIISIADAGGLVVNGSGVSTTGDTITTDATVTINGIDSSLHNTTIAAGKGMLIETTSTLNTYTYHRLVVDEAGVASAQTLVSDFNDRYQIAGSAPSNHPDGSALADGDLWFNTNTNTMMVYDLGNTSYAAVTSVGDYKLLTVVDAGQTSGTPTWTNTTFDLRDGSSAANVTSAGQLIISVNGVIQKPNAGSSQPTEGFALVDSNTIIFSNAPGAGAAVFVTLIGSATSVNVPATNSVATGMIQNLAVDSDKLAADAVIAGKIADDAVGVAELSASGTAGNTTYLRGDNSWTVPPDTNTNILSGGTIVGDVTWDNGTNAGKDMIWDESDDTLKFNDDVQISLGSDRDVRLYHTGSHGYINVVTGDLNIRTNSTEPAIVCTANGSVAAYHDNAKKFETSATGATVTGTLAATAVTGDGSGLTGIDAGATGGGTDKIFWENGTTIDTNYTIGTTFGAACNAMSAGPITINTGKTVTVDAGDTWTIV